MQRWTNDLFVSTPHAWSIRRAPRATPFRCSSPPITTPWFGCSPNAPGPDNPPRYPPTHAGHWTETMHTHVYTYRRHERGTIPNRNSPESRPTPEAQEDPEDHAHSARSVLRTRGVRTPRRGGAGRDGERGTGPAGHSKPREHLLPQRLRVDERARHHVPPACPPKVRRCSISGSSSAAGSVHRDRERDRVLGEEDEPLAFVARDLSRRGLKQGRIGMDIGSIHTPSRSCRCWDALDAEPCLGQARNRAPGQVAENSLTSGRRRRLPMPALVPPRAVEEGQATGTSRPRAQAGLARANSEFYSLEPIICVGLAGGRSAQSAGRHSGGGRRLGIRRALRRQGALPRTAHEDHLCRHSPVRVRELADYSNAVCEALLETIRPGIPASDVRRRGGQGARADPRADRLP